MVNCYHRYSLLYRWLLTMPWWIISFYVDHDDTLCDTGATQVIQSKSIVINFPAKLG